MSKKTKSSTKPMKEAMPFLMGGANNLQSTYNDNAGTIQGLTDQVTGLMPSAVDNYIHGNPALNAAAGYNADVLSGRYLDNGNPWLQSIIDRTNNDVANSVQAKLGSRGLTGGSDYTKIMSREMANNEANLRYGAYNDERGNMATAAGQSPSLAAAQADQLTPILSILGASSAPLSAASQYAQGISGLFGPYSTTTQKQGLGNTLASLASSGLAGWASGGFRGA